MVATAASWVGATAAPWRRRAEPALLFGCLLVALVLLGDRLLGDPDTLWHVALGRQIWRTGTLPWTDSFSHTVAGAPWIAKEWLSQLILASADGLLGWRGVVLLAAASVSLVFAMLFGWLAARTRTTTALAVTLVAAMLLAPHALARPHVLALLPLVLWTGSLLRAAESGAAPPFRSLLVVVLWANLHGSVTFAYPLAGLLAADAVLRAPRLDRPALVRRWTVFLAGAVLAGCVTPYGPMAMAVTATTFGSGEALPYLTEWQPLALDPQGIAALASAAALLGALALEPGRNTARIALVLLLAAMMVRHSRFVDLFALVAPMVAAGPILRRFGASGERDSTSAGAPGLAARLAPAALVALALVLAAATSPRPPDRIAPAVALAAARDLRVAGPVYNDYDFGGFLMRQGVPTFIDGRTDQLFLSGFISTLHRAVDSPDPTAFLALLDRYGVTWALIRPGSREARHLDSSPRWTRAYEDGAAAVYRRG